MSTDIREDEDAIPEPRVIDREDGFKELDTRETLRILISDPAVRNYTFAAFGALGMIFLILLQQASDIGALLIAIVGVCGLLLRWGGAPAFVLLLLTYFMYTPFGIPGESEPYRFEIEQGRFRVTDVMLVMSVLVYVACQFRILSIVSQGVTFEGAVRRKGEVPARRPPALIRPAELAVLFGVCAAFVVFGQAIWWFVNAVEVEPLEDFPLQWREERPRNPFDPENTSGMNTGTTRFVVLVGLLFFGTLAARLVFGYWRLRMMGPAEGGMVLIDNGWSETSRERQRQETWRIWGRKRIEAEEAEQTGRGGKS